MSELIWYSCNLLVGIGVGTTSRLGADQVLLRWLGVRQRGLLPRLALVHAIAAAGLCLLEVWMALNRRGLASVGYGWLVSMLATAEYGMMRLVRVPGGDGVVYAIGVRHALVLAVGGYGLMVTILGLLMWLGPRAS